jgi:cytochrome c oxidase subunit 4
MSTAEASHAAHADHAHDHFGHGHGDDGHGHDHDDGAVHVHVASSGFYWGIFGALICLTLLTVKVSYYDFGSANILIALVVATMKASLVAAFFMHLRHDKLFNTLSFLAAFLFLAIFIFLTYDDVGRRGRVEPTYGSKVLPQTGAPAPGGEPATSATTFGEGASAPAGKGEKKE